MDLASEAKRFFCRVPRRQARLRLLCFPAAGAGVTLFHRWPDGLPEDVEVHALQLPGRESRRREPLLYDLERLMEDIVPAVSELADRPLALFGFSMGAVVAFEAARRLGRDKLSWVRHLFVAARRAPQVPGDAPIHRLSDEEFVHALQHRYEALSPVIVDNPDLLAFFLSVIRADMTLLESYVYQDGPPLSCPLTVYAGSDDVSTSPEDLAAWRRQTSSCFALRLYPGGHFFPQTCRDELLHDLAGRLTIP